MALSPIFRLADDHVAELAALDPIAATGLGVPGHDHRLTDYSPDGHRARADLARRTRDAVRTAPRTDDHDRLAADVIDDLLDTELEAFDAGEWTYALRTLASPVSGIRSVFDLMPRQGTEAWDAIASRLHAVPAALDGVRATFDHGLATGHVAARRQALATAAQCTTWAETRWFDTLTGEARRADGLPAALVERVAAGADEAIAAYDAFARYLRDDYAPQATETDACGPTRYAVNTRTMLGARLDPGEMYDWAWTDFHELRSDMRRTCEQILPGAGFGEVRDLLDTDPARALHSPEAYQAWLQEVTDTAIERSLALFDVPEPMRRCEARIPPAGSAAAPYYTPPSEDFSRPARTWYPLLGRSSFPMWGDVTTCFHESVPGHHLQIGYTLTRASTLSRIQRTSFVSGHGEGWALYAERLADELGWFENPDQRLGFLAGQMLRTVRVIVDIGMHLGIRIPEGTTLTDGTPFHGGEEWTPALAYEFAVSETGQGETFLASEIDRYLGWPAQAISYKIGEREWLAARDDARRRLGAAFDLRAFHTDALGLGPLGLAQLRSELQHHAV
ncbi:MAG: DUF885 family protein [Actinobacteria bacterium]|uniref:Unannotated protein n=1 Tax=freshwater metagenome TaxID=449393 RepID=A0A6J6DUA6_9ZZZZ|nr:DUF885 family protein [Actinomycetota bacterium]